MTRNCTHLSQVLVCIGLLGCGGETARRLSDATGGSANLGGQASAGGTSANGGNSSVSSGTVSTGGLNAAGGTVSDNSSGGVSGGFGSTGGSPASGGMGSGGVPATGGFVSTGGRSTTGGVAVTGGSNSSGGSSAATGGKTSNGSTATGGNKSTGGSSTTGGASKGGASNATGGAANTGGGGATGGSMPTGGALGSGGSATNGGSPATGGGSSSPCNVTQAGLPTNVALNKPSTANKNPQASGLAIDGDTTTNWGVGDGSLGNWWAVDLKQPYALTEIDTQWEYGGVPYKYYVEISTDGVNYDIAVDQRSNTQGLGTFTDAFKQGTCARFVRITMTDASGYWMILYEVRILALVQT